MLAFLGILLLCWVILLMTNFIGEIIGDGFRSAMIALTGLGICAALLIGFFVVHL